MQGIEPTKSSLGKITDIEGKYFIKQNNKVSHIDLQCLSYREDINDWLSSILDLTNETPNIKAGIHQYLNLLKMLTDELITVNKELKKMLIDITPVELEAIRKLSNQYNSSDYRGELLYELFKYVERKFIECGDLNVSDKYPEINYTH